jgi:hypothetical protein
MFCSVYRAKGKLDPNGTYLSQKQLQEQGIRRLVLRNEAQQLQLVSSPLLGFASSPPTYKKLLQLATGVVSEQKSNPNCLK